MLPMHPREQEVSRLQGSALAHVPRREQNGRAESEGSMAPQLVWERRVGIGIGICI